MKDVDAGLMSNEAFPTVMGDTSLQGALSVLLLWGSLLAAAWAMSFPPQARAGTIEAVIRVDCQGAGPAVNQGLLGQNVPVSLSGIWDSTSDRMHSSCDAVVRQIRPSVLRFPGGSLSDLYVWEDGLSQLIQNPVAVNDSTLTLQAAPSWKSVFGARFLGSSAGRYGDPFQFLELQGNVIRGARGIQRPHPSGTPVRLDHRNGQPDWFQNGLGSPELIKLAEALGSELLLTVNFGTGIDVSGNLSVSASVDQRIMRAAAWVAYMNGSVSDSRPIGVDPEGNDWQTVGHWARKRADGGREAPMAVTYWEVGNELFWASEAGCTTAEEYARGFIRFARAMKAIDPSIRVGAAGMSQPEGRGDRDARAAWNGTVLRLAKADMDFLAVHPYYPSALRSQVSYGSEDWFRGVMAGGSQAASHLEKIREEMDRTEPVGKKLEMVVSESGIWPADSRDARDYSNLARAITDADLLLQLLRAGDRWGVVRATGWNLHSSTETALIRHDWATGLATLRPQYHAFHMLRGLDGGRRVSVSVEGPTFSSPKFGNMEGLQAIPVLDAAGFLGSGGRLSLLVVNRDLHNAVQAAVHLSECLLQGTGSARVLAGPAPSAHNEDPLPGVQPASQPVDASSRPVVQSFPPHSITLMELNGPEPGGSRPYIVPPREFRNIDEG